MIPISQQGIEDVFRFKIKASLTLEYLPAKAINACDEKTTIFLTTLITSMANANGGTIFIGIHALRKLPKSIDALADSNKFDWLQIICQTQIFPIIPNCLFEKIVISENGEFIIGIQIPNSHLAPHMNSDRRFYRRADTKAVLLEEYEIRDLYTKGKRPEIELFSVSNTNGIPILSKGKFQTINFYPRFLVKNTGNCVEHFYKVELSIPSILNNPNFNNIQDYFSRFDDGNSIYCFTGKNALFQGEIASVIEPNFVVDANSYKTFENGEITLKFFYSSGVQTKTFHCKELLLYRNKQIELQDFAEEQSILTDSTL